MQRKPDWIDPRKAFPKAVRVAILKRSGGMCELPECCSVGAEFDHYPTPVAFGGESVLANCRFLCRFHNAELGVQTASRAAEADRKGGRTGQWARKQRRKEAGKESKLQGQGFSKKYRKKMNGTVERIEIED